MRRPGSAACIFFFLIFIFFPRALRFSSFYATVRTRQSVPGFEVRCCSSLSAQSVLESPAGESRGAARQPATVGRRQEEGEKPFAFFFPLSSAFFTPQPDSNLNGLNVDASRGERCGLYAFPPTLFLDKNSPN